MNSASLLMFFGVGSFDAKYVPSSVFVPIRIGTWTNFPFDRSSEPEPWMKSPSLEGVKPDQRLRAAWNTLLSSAIGTCRKHCRPSAELLHPVILSSASYDG